MILQVALIRGDLILLISLPQTEGRQFIDRDVTGCKPPSLEGERIGGFPNGVSPCQFQHAVVE